LYLIGDYFSAVVIQRSNTINLDGADNGGNNWWHMVTELR